MTLHPQARAYLDALGTDDTLNKPHAAVAPSSTEQVQEIAKVEAYPRMEGRQMLMVLAPAPKKKSGTKEVSGSAQDQDTQSHV